ncbi:MAG: HtaA domain-containing protein [Protaetiibacter sp.]
MSYAPARARVLAPWITLLLIPLIALAGALAPATPAAATGPAITVTVTAATEADGLTVRVVGSDFTGITGAYAAIIEKDQEAAVSTSGGYIAFGYWMPPAVTFTDGTFDRTLVAATASLDRTKQYEVIVWQGHTTPDAATIYARADIEITSTHWNTLFPPTFGITVDPADIANGTVKVTGTFPTSYTATNGTTQTTGLYLMYCVQPDGEPGSGASGRASGSANCNSSAQKWVVQPDVTASAGTTQIGTVDGGVWTFATTVDVTSTFAARSCLDATSADEGGVQCGIAVRLDHNSGSGGGATYTFDQFVAVNFAAPDADPEPAITVAVTGADASDGLSVQVVGTGFDGIDGVYAAIIEKDTEAAVGTGGGYAAFGYWMPPSAGITDGAFTRTLVAPVSVLAADTQYEVIVWQGHTTPDSTTIYDRTDIEVSDAQWAAIFPDTDDTDDTDTDESDDTGTEESVTTPTPSAGSLSWGVKASFRSYITGSIAQGSITTSGVSTSGSSYVFPQSGDAALTDGLGTVSYSGSVRFTGHGGELDLRLSDPQLRIESATTGTLLVRVNGSARVAFASLALGTGSRTTGTDGTVSYSGVPATLTAAGATAFSSFYSAGTALDPVSFTIGSAGESLGGTVVVATASTTTSNTPDATPPATTGITTSGELVEGGEITAEADGFQPNETGILVVVYSTPIVLADDLVADANGRASWTGTLPLGLTGEHTLTFQGTVDRGAVLDIRAAVALPCTVSDASLAWGFKESFRAYIDGSIANGEWTTDGEVSYATPVFTWAGGTGGAGEDGALDVQFSGSVRFTGHGGVLDTTIANPRVVVDGDRAVLLLDVTGTTQEGDAVSAAAVEFAELGLADVTSSVDGDVVSWTEVPAALTEAGASAFGTYPAGEALDPITLTATVSGDCTTGTESPVAAPSDDGLDTAPTADAGWPGWATLLIIALLVVAIVAAVVVLLVRRRRS